MKLTFVKFCTGMREMIRDEHVHTKQDLLCNGWGKATYFAAELNRCWVQIAPAKKTLSIACKFFAGFEESLRSPVPW